MKKRNWLWGVLLVLAAGVIILGQPSIAHALGLHHLGFGRIGFWTILLTVPLVIWLLNSISRRSVAGIFVPLALLYMLYQKPLNLFRISPWALIAAAILASIGFSLLFRRRPVYVAPPAPAGYLPQNQSGAPGPPPVAQEEGDDNNPWAKINFGSLSKYVHADALRTGQLYASFGAMDVFFDGSELAPEGAELYVDCNFGTLKLYVPRHWKVISEVRATLGACENMAAPPDPGAAGPYLAVKGYVAFGSVEIRYI